MKCPERKISQCILPFRNLTKFTGTHLCQILFLNKVTGLMLVLGLQLYLKRDSDRGDVKFFRTPFLYNISVGCFCKCTSSVFFHTWTKCGDLLKIFFMFLAEVVCSYEPCPNHIFCGKRTANKSFRLHWG